MAGYGKLNTVAGKTREVPMSTAPSSTSSITRPPVLEAVLDQLIEREVQMPCRAEVTDYLGSHPDVVDLLPRICDRARQSFVHGELVLKVNLDPEIDDPYLMLYVRVWPYPADMGHRLEEVWAPFEEQLAGSSGWVVISTDYQQPEKNRGGI
jgi:hypothetical protein